jgi:hypothetical protein
MAPLSTGREIWRRAYADWKGGNWLFRALVTATLALVATLLLSPMLGRWKMTAHWPMWTPGFIGTVGALLLWGVLTFTISLLRAPGKLLKKRDKALEIANAKILHLDCISQQLNEALRDRDIARGERDEARGERDKAHGERDALQ